MRARIKARVKLTGDVAEVKILATHQMETGLRKDGNGNIIPAHHITDLTAKHKDEVVFVASMGPAVSKNPYLAFSVQGVAKGDTIDLAWVDNQGDSATLSAKVK